MAILDSFLQYVRPKRVNPRETIGVGGTAVYGGFLQSNEKSQRLVGTEKYRTYSEMMANVSIVASGVRYFLGLILRTNWKLEAAEGAGGEEAKELVESIMNDMTTPWARVARRAALYRFHGFSVQEWTAKIRDDGRIGLMDIEPRPQQTIEQWDLDRSGTVHGILQRSPQTMELLYLPRQKCVYMVDDSISDSPEGVGLLRHVVEATYRLQRYEQLEAFAFETDLRGIPIGRAPYNLLDRKVQDGTMTTAQKASLIQGLQSFIENHIRSPQLGAILESATYTSLDEAATPSDQKLWDLDLLKGDGTSPNDAVAVAIERVNREIARVLGVENLLLGEKGAGSLALSKDKSNNFATLVDGTNEEMAQVFQKDFVYRVCELNGIPRELAPTLKPDKAQFREVEQITAALESMGKAGAVLPPDDPAINEVRDMLGISRQDPDQIADFALAQQERDMALIQAKAGPNDNPNPDDNQ